MAVYTTVSLEQAQSLCSQLNLGNAVSLEPIAGGIENTNYFLFTQLEGLAPTKRVLTLFERLMPEQLPYYLGLMQHLAAAGIPVPDPVAGLGSGHPLVHGLCGKPTSVVSCLQGKSELNPGPEHCRQLGGTLARMHLAARTFDPVQPNLRGLDWWNATATGLFKHLESGQRKLLQHELAHQNHMAQSAAHQALPRAAVHADLFRDNVMFVNNEQGQPQLSGVFDFYFAGHDSLLFDLCVALNDWAIDLATGHWKRANAHALLSAYQVVRPLQAAERALFHTQLRAAALRFWISRLWDWHQPREASLLKPHDPAHFERVLTQRSTVFEPLLLGAA
jgi:homoserine kinase type II